MKDTGLHPFKWLTHHSNMIANISVSPVTPKQIECLQELRPKAVPGFILKENTASTLLLIQSIFESSSWVNKIIPSCLAPSKIVCNTFARRFVSGGGGS